MALRIKLKNSVVQDRIPTTSDLPAVGELAVNANINSIGGFMRASDNSIVKIFGPGSLSTPVASDTVAGISELATNAETTGGTATDKVVTPAGLNAVTVAERTTSDSTYLALTGGSLSGGLTVSGTVAATALSGDGSALTSIPAGELTGTVADARITSLTASKLTGALPAIDGSALTNLPAGGLSDIVNDTTPELGGDLETNGFNILIENEKELRLFENSSNGTNYTSLKAAANVASSVTFTLPNQDGSNGHCIQTDGSGNLSFRSVQPTIIFDQSSLSTQLMSGNNGILEIQGNTQIAFDRDTSTAYKTYFQANSTQLQNVTFTLPAADGSSGQVLKTDGSGVLSFTDAGSGLVGSSNEKLFVEAENQMDNSFTTTANFNYVAASPMIVASGATLTVSANSTMTFV